MKRSQFFLWLMAISFCVTGCGYGEVSPVTYDLATSLYNISNRKLEDRIDPIKERIEQAEMQNEISTQEAKWLMDINAKAERGEWESAMESARRMMEDQVAEE